jgi:hypothetical protein
MSVLHAEMRFAAACNVREHMMARIWRDNIGYVNNEV